MSLARWLTPLQQIPVQMRDGRRLFLDLREPMCMPYLLAGEIWEEAGETHFMRHFVRSGDSTIDVGANVGWYTTLLAEAVGPSGFVSALEPNPAAYRLLTLTTRRYPQVVTIAAAAGDREGEEELHIPRDAGMASLAAHPDARKRVRCRKVTLDSIWTEAGSPAVTLLKCDAEGAERDILAGATQCLSAKLPPVLLLELGPLSWELWGYRPEELVQWLHARFPGTYCGYRLHSKTGRLEPLPEPMTFRFDAAFVPRWATGRLANYIGI